MEQEVRLQKAEQMYTYSCDHNFGKGLSRAWGLNSFRLVEQAMDADEFAYLTFIGLHRFHSMSAHQRNFAYAFTRSPTLLTICAASVRLSEVMSPCVISTKISWSVNSL